MEDRAECERRSIGFSRGVDRVFLLDYYSPIIICAFLTYYRIMHKVYKFRLYPTKAQESKLERTLELCRQVYNETLAYRKDKYE